jgi:hypothetical protein
MWKHRAYVKALVRQETVQLKHSEQLVLMLIADHCNDDADKTSFTNSRLGDMTQSAVVTIRAAVKKLVKLNILSVEYRPGKAPTYHLPIPKSFSAESDTELDVGRANIPSFADRAASSMDAALHLMGMTAEQVAMCVFQGVEGMDAGEAKVQAQNAFKGSGNPSTVLLEQCKIALKSPVKTVEIVELSTEEQRLVDLDTLFETPRAGESQAQYNNRVGMGRLRWDRQQAAMSRGSHNAQGK